ncbi:alpha-ketoacid dehydrogenase subunit beta [Conexibacter sp. CPCC 206217]|uniref:alpha-ketoacid dehydrogenase subunit beta n=1 Tax=Conexibacter sp. CPCC 206217 TaxID=3064574 RepID=UPI0027227146|nr:transketolase C-terminal domain-containing protein [Conexibacter sp. CPCC 206217]MDO8210183.1 transketolase C-terminal domain-containing protein [Conexibacter sp. CPCC 206217]
MSGVGGPASVAARAITQVEAIREAMLAEMERDERTMLLGEDVVGFGGIYGQYAGLRERFGAARVRDTPISEAGFIGAAAGAAVAGMRPIAELMIVDFFGVAMDQIANYVAKVHYSSAGTRRVPLTLITSAGNPLRQGATHGQTLHGMFAHIPGLKVALPATSHDAKGMLISAIRDDDPVLYMVHRALLGESGLPGDPDDALRNPAVAREPYEVEFGRAAVRRRGSDVTIVAFSLMTHTAVLAADVLAEEGIEAEVLDPRTLVPLDTDAILESVAKTGRLLVLDEDYRSFGASGEIVARVVESGAVALKAPPRRLARADRPIPYSRVLEAASLPGPDAVAAAVRELVGAA